VQELKNVATQQFLTVQEPSRLRADFHPQIGEFQVVLTGARGLAYLLESSTDLIHWIPAVWLTNQSGTVTWTNLPTISIPTIFFRARE
jgi:hypothetical protein